MTENPNERQVGGSHYRNKKIQHWDLMKRFRVGYFEGQITKYSDRHKRKDGRQALQKSIHFCEKMIEDVGVESRANVGEFDLRLFAEFVAQGELDAKQVAIYALALTWRGHDDARRLLSLLREYEAEYYGPEEPSRSPPSFRFDAGELTIRAARLDADGPGTPEDGGQHARADEEDAAPIPLRTRVWYVGSHTLFCGLSGVVVMSQVDRLGVLRYGVVWDGRIYTHAAQYDAHDATSILRVRR